MHSKEYLDDWYMAHLFGAYKHKPILAIDIPPVILREFDIDPDLVYFKTHNKLELKHYEMARQFLELVK